MPSQIDLMDSNPNYHPYRDNYTPGSSPFLPAGGQYEPTPYMLSQSNLPHPQHPSQFGQDPTGPVGHPQYQNVQPYTDYTHGPPPQPYGHVPPPVGAIPLGHRPGAPSVSNTEATSSAEQSNRQSMASTTLTAAQRKAAMAGESAYKPPSRFILHTDADDELPPPNEDGIVELPPQYTERRAPSTPLQTQPQPPANAPYPPPADAYQPQS
ncbi:hypothetical protein ONZ45_g2272 [Pleurotus djamor]|nr:hypothetical protein ONZ45_g2272 [Pleurotus djamor]